MSRLSCLSDDDIGNGVDLHLSIILSLASLNGELSVEKAYLNMSDSYSCIAESNGCTSLMRTNVKVYYGLFPIYKSHTVAAYQDEKIFKYTSRN